MMERPPSLYVLGGKHLFPIRTSFTSIGNTGIHQKGYCNEANPYIPCDIGNYHDLY